MTETKRPDTGLASDSGLESRWEVLAVLVLPLVLVVSANSGLNVALPALVDQVGATQTQLQWIVDAYALVFAGLVLTAGALGDRYGRRLWLLAGLTVFGVAATAAPVFAAPGAVIVARAIMGLGAAMIMPATLSILVDVFPEVERGRAIGVWAGFAGAGAIAGPVVSGLLLEWFWWGSVFFINLPIVAVAVAGTLWLVPSSRDETRRRLDPIGGAASMVALAGILFAIIEAPERGWTDPATLTALVTGVVFAGLFLWWESRTSHPMIELSWFADRRFSVGAATITFGFVAGIGFGFLLPQYLQFVLDFSPLQAGLASLPFATAMLYAAPRSDRLVRRFGASTAIAVGLGIGAVGLGYLSVVSTADAGFLVQIPGIAAVGTAIGLATAPSTTMILSALPGHRSGVGSAVNDTTREVGISLGVASIGSILTAVYRANVAVSELSEQAMAAARESIGAALVYAQETGGETAATLTEVTRTAFTSGYRISLIAAAGIAGLTGLGVKLLGPESSHSSDSSQHPDDRMKEQ